MPRRVLAALAVLLAAAPADRAAAQPAPADAAPAPARRVVSLLPSLTEDLFAIGAGRYVVGVSSHTDAPAAATRLPVVSSFDSVDAERVVALRPDLVVAEPPQARLAEDLRRAGLRVELVRQDGYDQIFTAIARLGALTGRERAAAALARSLHARAAAIAARVPAGPRPAVFVVLDTAPIYTTGDGSYIARLVRLAGGRNAASGLREPYGQFGAEALVALQPDVLVAARTAGLREALARPPWSALRAVRGGRVEILSDPDLLERPGPRFVEGLAWLARSIRRAAPERAHPRAPRPTAQRRRRIPSGV